MMSDAKPLRRLLRKGKMRLPDIAFRPRLSEEPPQKTPISRKALQAFFGTAGRRPISPPHTSPKRLSYSKLLQETPDTFRLQHMGKKAADLPPRPCIKKVGSLAGIQGVKSPISGPRSLTERKSSIHRLPPKVLRNPRTMEKAQNCSFDIEEESDPYALDISPDRYLREVRSQQQFPRAWPETC